jgi:hypothetical protein
MLPWHMYLLHTGFSLDLFFGPDYEGNIFLQSVCKLSVNYIALCTTVSGPQILQLEAQFKYPFSDPKGGERGEQVSK